MRFSNDEKAKEAEREVLMRKSVYGRHSDATMTPLQKRRIAMMEEIADDYRKLAQADAPALL